MNRILLLAGLVMALMLCGCQKSPDSGAVISRNDGAFDANVIVSASEEHTPDETQSVEIFETFYSTDGSVEFRMEIQEELTNRNMPVVEVEPHFLTAEEVKRVGLVLFGNVDFYESQPWLAPNLSKRDIQEKINRWSPYVSEEAVRSLYGDAAGQESQLTLIRDFFEKYTKLYEVAPEEETKETCRWEFRKSSCYFYAPEDVTESSLKNDNDEISATVKAGGVVYEYSASVRNREDFKISSIFLFPSDGSSPGGMDERIFQAMLCRTPEPTEAQLSAIREKAERILQEIKLGDWLINRCYVETQWYGNVAEYIVHVDAVPVFNGAPAIRRPQLTNLRSEDAYASNYYLTDVNMEFSANGEILSFYLASPVDMKQTLNENVAVMSMDSLMELARNYLTYSDAYNYGFGEGIPMAEEALSCIVHIRKLTYNQTRVKVPDTDESYYYIPGIVLSGAVEYIGKETGNLYFSAEDTTLISLNGVDGSRVS